LPGEPTPEPTRTTRAASNGDDQTEQTCDDALEVSNNSVTELNDQVEDVQSAIAANNTAAATSAGLAAKATATAWRDELADLAERPISDDLRGVLNDGVDMIDGILETDPRQLDADEVQGDVDAFMDDLEQVCG
jgi:hypothetical protein